MSKSTEKTIEKDLAEEQNRELQEHLIAKRTRHASFSILFVLLSGGAAFAGFWMIALASIVLGLVFLSEFFDASGHSHEVPAKIDEISRS